MLYSANVMINRKYRWTIEAEASDGKKIDPCFIKLTSRPMDNGEIDVTFFDPGQLWSAYLPFVQENSEPDPDKLLKFTLTMYDGCGNKIETHQLYDAHINRVNLNDLDFSSYDPSVPSVIQMWIKYKKWEYKSETSRHVESHASMGLGTLMNKTICPKCNHEFVNCIFK